MDYDLEVDVDDTSEGSSTQETSNPVRQLREKLKATEKENKSFLKELEELRAIKTEFEYQTKVSSFAEPFTKLGLSDKHVELYLKLNPDADADESAIREFAKEYGLPVSGDTGGDTDTSSTEPFRPAEGGDSIESGRITRAQLEDMYRENPAKAIKMLRTGRVVWNNQ